MIGDMSPRHLRGAVVFLLALAVSGEGASVAVRPGKVVHVVVALCDNQYQGIVPVPAKLGNGDDPANNLYWGAAFGVKTFFRKAGDWVLVSATPVSGTSVLERVIFKHRKEDVYLVADAYRGRDIRRATWDFLRFSSGRDAGTVEIPSGRLSTGGGADLVVYVGHDGLMDFSVPAMPRVEAGRGRDVIILACASRGYFAGPLRQAGGRPLLWTTGLMAPEAYVLKAALDGWILGEDGEKTRNRAAGAYHKYQGCSLKSALKLFATGW
jgi:hypothetical protein